MQVCDKIPLAWSHVHCAQCDNDSLHTAQGHENSQSIMLTQRESLCVWYRACLFNHHVTQEGPRWRDHQQSSQPAGGPVT